MIKKYISIFIVIISVLAGYSINCSAVNGDYTGWASNVSKTRRYYFKDGVRLTGVNVFPDGTRYVFDNDGVYLGQRSSNEDFDIIVDNNYTVEVSNEKLDIGLKITSDSSSRFYSTDEYFRLDVYKNGRWVEIPYVTHVIVDGEVIERGYASEEVSTIAGVESTEPIHLSRWLSDFDYEFKPGLYRVRKELDCYESDKFSEFLISKHIVMTEFNMI